MLIENHAGGYAYIPSLGFASAGVVSLPGMTIVHALFREPLPLRQGFEAVRRHMDLVGRPLVALCGFELRMPAVLDWTGFDMFNAPYVAQLESWGLLRDGAPPLTRTNVVPTSNSLQEDAVAAFSYTIQTPDDPKAFIISGAPEMIAGAAPPDNIYRRGETSEAALIDKTRCATAAVRERIDELGTVWDNACAVRLYSRWPLALPLQRQVLAEAGLNPTHGVIWLDTEPPVFELELEIDVRRYAN